MTAAALEAAQRVLRDREDAEIARICTLTADRDRALAKDGSGTLADGIA